jgi:hypothetical protein
MRTVRPLSRSGAAGAGSFRSERVVTGVVLTAEDIAAVTEAQLYAAPSLVYAGPDGG